LDGRAAFLGFMSFPPSPRHIALEDAARLARPARGRSLIVVVTVDPDDALIDQIAKALAPDLIQLHGKESPSRVREVAARSGARIIKAIGVAGAGDLHAARDYDEVTEHVMFDARAPADADRPGGLGASFDWSILSGFRLARPWLLAGGLDPWNVRAATTASGARLVDVSSGVERGAGLKDPALIKAFLEAVGRD
jgi:phosphoribosylanthranilate isomerase